MCSTSTKNHANDHNQCNYVVLTSNNYNEEIPQRNITRHISLRKIRHYGGGGGGNWMTHNSVFNRMTQLLLLLCITQIHIVSCLLCYSCVSSEPGCTLEKVDWLIHSAVSCPASNDKCVKIIEQRGAENRVVRGCLSQLLPYRRDIPADHYEGCRPAANGNINRATYVFNAISELGLKSSSYDNVTYCFCEFDHWCNGAMHTHSTSSIMIGTIVVATILTMMAMTSFVVL